MWNKFAAGVASGVLVTVLSTLILQAFGRIEITLPGTYVNRLDDFPDVLRHATQVMNEAETTLNIATDVAANGVLSAKPEGDKYTRALEAAATRPGLTTTVVWLTRGGESKVIDLERHSPSKTKWTDAEWQTGIETSQRLRSAYPSAFERDLPSLGLFNFWVSRPTSAWLLGRHVHSVVAFNQGSSPDDPVSGFETNSDAVAEILISLQKRFQQPEMVTEARKYYGALVPCSSSPSSVHVPR